MKTKCTKNRKCGAIFSELLAALKDIVDDIEHGTTEWETNGTLAYAKQAIKKAERMNEKKSYHKNRDRRHRHKGGLGKIR